MAKSKKIKSERKKESKKERKKGFLAKKVKLTAVPISGNALSNLPISSSLPVTLIVVGGGEDEKLSKSNPPLDL